VAGIINEYLPAKRSADFGVLLEGALHSVIKPVPHTIVTVQDVHEQVIAELQSSGFDATVIDESLPYQYVVVGR
jgi:hypothetical protein